jgi:hypothetical protein
MLRLPANSSVVLLGPAPCMLLDVGWPGPDRVAELPIEETTLRCFHTRFRTSTGPALNVIADV